MKARNVRGPIQKAFLLRKQIKSMNDKRSTAWPCCVRTGEVLAPIECRIGVMTNLANAHFHSSSPWRCLLRRVRTARFLSRRSDQHSWLKSVHLSHLAIRLLWGACSQNQQQSGNSKRTAFASPSRSTHRQSELFETSAENRLSYHFFCLFRTN